MNEATSWLPGLVVLALSVVGAVLYLLLGRKNPDVVAPKNDDLSARYEALLTQLRQHVANKHLLPEPLWLQQKAELEKAAADVLRQKAEGAKAAGAKAAAAGTTPAAKAAAAAPAPAGDGTLRGALIGGAVVLFVVLVGWQLSEASKPRDDDGSMGGPMQGQQQDQGPSAEDLADQSKLRAKIEAVRKNPDDVDALADAAVYMLRKQAFEEARPYVTRAMSLDPYCPKARVGRAVLDAVDGKIPAAMSQLEHLGRTYPEAYDARLFAGLIALEMKDEARAVDNLERYLAVAPPDDAPPMMRAAVMQMKEQLQGRPPAP